LPEPFAVVSTRTLQCDRTHSFLGIR
jgi:hypothetical protein